MVLIPQYPVVAWSESVQIRCAPPGLFYDYLQFFTYYMKSILTGILIGVVLINFPIRNT